MLTVGILGATGFMGAPFARALIKAHRAGQLRFVILHRPESNVNRFPPDIEQRCIDLQNGSLEATASALSDLQVVISTVSWIAENVQHRLIDALKDSPNLVTFFPSEFATPLREEDTKSGFMARSSEKGQLVNYCVEQGVPYTRLYNATVPKLLFEAPAFSPYKPEKNEMTLYWPLGEGKRGLTSEEFSGQALVHLLLDRLDELPNKDFSLVEIHWSAEDMINVFKKLHDGKEPTIIKFTEEEYQEKLGQSPMDALGAAGKKGLAVGVKWPGEVVSSVPGWQPKTLEDYARRGLTAKPLTFADVRGGSDLSKE